MHTNDVLECFSDLFKGINGFRPRGMSGDYVSWFMNNYDRLFEDSLQEEKAELAHLSEKHGQNFASMMAYYDFKEAADYLAYEQKKAADNAAKRERNDLHRRNSPRMAIYLWEHGEDIL